MICAKCGKDNEGGAYFCKYCGSLLNSGATEDKTDYSIPTYKSEITKTEDTTKSEQDKPYAPWMNSTNTADWNSNQTQDNTYQQNNGYQNNGYQNNAYQNNAYPNNVNPVQNDSKAKNYNFVTGNYTPISMWGYVGYELLFSLPCVGLFILVFMAFGASNVNVKNFARSYFCMYLIVFIIVILLYLTGNSQLLSFYK